MYSNRIKLCVFVSLFCAVFIAFGNCEIDVTRNSSSAEENGEDSLFSLRSDRRATTDRYRGRSTDRIRTSTRPTIRTTYRPIHASTIRPNQNVIRTTPRYHRTTTGRVRYPDSTRTTKPTIRITYHPICTSTIRSIENTISTTKTTRNPKTTKKPPYPNTIRTAAKPPPKSTTHRVKVTTKGPRPTTTIPPMNWKLTSDRYKLLFGGLAGTALGAYLGYQISQINWEANVPAYSVQHYWHQGANPVLGNTVIENQMLSDCAKNGHFCIVGTVPMCLSNGKIYCVVPQGSTQPCSNSSMGLCVHSSVRLPCQKPTDECNFFGGWRYEEVSVPCIRYVKVKYTKPSTKYDEKFKIPDNTSKTNNTNSTCKCSTTQTPLLKSKIEITCMHLYVDEKMKNICSGMDLSNNTLVSMDVILNFINAKYFSCEPPSANNNATMLNIFTSKAQGLLSRCEILNGTGGSIEMMCGYVGDLTSSNVTIPADPNIIGMSCKFNSSIQLHNNLTGINNTITDNNTVNATACFCNETVTNITSTNNSIPKNNVTSSINNTQKVFVSTKFCVYVAASPTRLYNNKNYFQHLDIDEQEKKAASSRLDNIFSTIAHFILF